jgi:uncharacterized membrane protein
LSAGTLPCACYNRGMIQLLTILQSLYNRTWRQGHFVGLVIGTIFLAESLTPSLLPRPYVVQGILSGIAAAVGYGIGVFLGWLWLYLEIPTPASNVRRWLERITTAAVLLVMLYAFWKSAEWQNSIRALMELPPVETAYPVRVAAIALVTFAVLLLLARGIRRLFNMLDRQVKRFVPRRIANFASAVLVAFGLLLVVNKVFVRLALDFADATFTELDQLVDDGVEQPTDPKASGSAESLVEWDDIGRRGKNFVVGGPTPAQLAEFWGRPTETPLRVYVGLASRETPEERAELALQELIRAGGFERSLLVIATPTGTGWLDPGAVDTLEYLHAGDTAIVSMQYSYLPSWITILVDPQRSQVSASALFDVVYSHWRSLPKEKRPKLYLHGLSLGAFGSELSGDLFTVFEDPPQGALWSGPPFPSSAWNRATQGRNPDSPMWLPTFRDGSILRFTGRESCLAKTGKRWSAMRCVYIQHASDPMCFFSPNLLYREPQWLLGQRGPDVSPLLRWRPIVTFLQTAFDLPMATTVPFGYGHNYAPASYIDSWVEVTAPKDWTAEQTTRLKELMADRVPPTL